LILASISSAFIIRIEYAIALVLVAIIAALLINVATRRNSTKAGDMRMDQKSKVS